MLRVLESVSLKAYPGQITTLLGSNGAANALKFCQTKGFPFLVTFVEQPFAGEPAQAALH